MKDTHLQDTILHQLREKGARITKNRIAVLNILTTIGRPLSVEELLALLKKNGASVNQTTIYREMDFLQKHGVIREIQLGNDRKRFELALGKHHHHIRCLDCGKIVDVNIPRELEHASKYIQQKTKFEVLDHSLEFIGRCSDCSAARA